MDTGDVQARSTPHQIRFALAKRIKKKRTNKSPHARIQPVEDISVGCSIFTPCFLITAICAERDKPFIDEELGGKQRTHIRARIFMQRRPPTQKKGQCYCFCLLAVDLQRQPPLLGWRQHDYRQRQHGNNTVYFTPNTESPAVLNSLTFAGLLCLLEIIQTLFKRGVWFRRICYRFVW